MSKLKRVVISAAGTGIIVILCAFVVLLIQTKVFGWFSHSEKQNVKLYFLDATLSKLSSEEQVVSKDETDILTTISLPLLKNTLVYPLQFSYFSI